MDFTWTLCKQVVRRYNGGNFHKMNRWVYTGAGVNKQVVKNQTNYSILEIS